MKVSLSIRLFVIVIACGVWSTGVSHAQNSGGGTLRITPSANVPYHSSEPVESVYAGDPAGSPVGVTVSVGTNANHAIRSAAEAVRDSKGNEAKTAAEKKLAELLNKYFDDDMTRRESELTKLEERLVKLRELHDRRRAKKQEIIELQAKVALNEADGLGFTNGGGQGLHFDGFDGRSLWGPPADMPIPTYPNGISRYDSASQPTSSTAQPFADGGPADN